jgi:hypothetical protein
VNLAILPYICHWTHQLLPALQFISLHTIILTAGLRILMSAISADIQDSMAATIKQIPLPIGHHPYPSADADRSEYSLDVFDYAFTAAVLV